MAASSLHRCGNPRHATCTQAAMYCCFPRCHQCISAMALSTVVFYWAVQWSWFARVNALWNLSRKKSQEVAASLPGGFSSRSCFMLGITMEVEPRTAKLYKCQHCCSCKTSFFGWLRLYEKKKKCLGASYSTSNKLLLVARHILTTSLQKCL